MNSNSIKIHSSNAVDSTLDTWHKIGILVPILSNTEHKLFQAVWVGQRWLALKWDDYKTSNQINQQCDFQCQYYLISSMTTEWEDKFPLSMVQALPRKISDHTPLLLKSGDNTSRSTQPQFKFETGWLLRDGFIDMKRDIWSNTSSGGTPMEEWQGKIR
jgi:hypothetical protein